MNERLAYIEKLEAQIREAQTILNRLKAEREQVIQQGSPEEIERLEEHLNRAQVKLDELLRNISKSLIILMRK